MDFSAETPEEKKIRLGGVVKVVERVLPAIAPFVRQYAHTDPAWFAAQPWQALTRWLAAFESSVLFSAIMVKHPPYGPSTVV